MLSLEKQRFCNGLTVKLYEEITDKTLLIRRITIAINRLTDETSVRDEDNFEQLDLFTNYDKI